MTDKETRLIVDEMSDKIIETAEKLVTLSGAGSLTVRRILQELKITNRVFYNRFHNVDEVLDVVYNKTAMEIRKSITDELDNGKDFFEHVMDVVVKSLLMSYDTKMQFNQYVFENDSLSESNYEWWTSQIKKLIDYAMEHDYIIHQWLLP